MKSVVYSRTGEPSVLRLVDREVAEPGPGEVRIRILVSGVTPPTGSRGTALAMVQRRRSRRSLLTKTVPVCSTQSASGSSILRSGIEFGSTWPPTSGRRAPRRNTRTCLPIGS